MPTSLFFAHNEALVPPYRVIIDTNFINLSLENRIDLVKAMMDVLYAKGNTHTLSRSHCLKPGTDLNDNSDVTAIPCISDCVLAELEKLGQKYRLALRYVLLPPSLSPSPLPLALIQVGMRSSVARDPRFERLPCSHKGTYADDCIVNRVTQHRCYIVATCDRQLRRRLRKVPGVPVSSLNLSPSVWVCCETELMGGTCVTVDVYR